MDEPDRAERPRQSGTGRSRSHGRRVVRDALMQRQGPRRTATSGSVDLVRGQLAASARPGTKLGSHDARAPAACRSTGRRRDPWRRGRQPRPLDDVRTGSRGTRRGCRTTARATAPYTAARTDEPLRRCTASATAEPAASTTRMVSSSTRPSARGPRGCPEQDQEERSRPAPIARAGGVVHRGPPWSAHHDPKNSATGQHQHEQGLDDDNRSGGERGRV